ncbi:MAG: bifunctional ADP-dependent NAD(P)H-hydrate dehydratase/NAD(P)H-hydrate epimerase, partial [Paramuribaculum sp.]|nr:bifunctional ADP-dependent NAD(P)H-hydrate dehydratase/NAD(P)H-hydrate epimerase [Paramuribaculum sp.]
MKIFNTEDIRAIDRRTMEIDGISSLELIDRVAQGVASEVVARWNPNRPVIVFAGPGNNGADALAVSRLLVAHGFNPSVYLLNIGGNRLSRDCRDCRDKLLADAPGID